MLPLNRQLTYIVMNWLHCQTRFYTIFRGIRQKSLDLFVRRVAVFLWPHSLLLPMAWARSGQDSYKLSRCIFSACVGEARKFLIHWVRIILARCKNYYYNFTLLNNCIVERHFPSDKSWIETWLLPSTGRTQLSKNTHFPELSTKSIFYQQW